MFSGELPSSEDRFRTSVAKLSGSGRLLGSGKRFAFAAMAALSTSAKGGLMPQARHGGSGKVSVAIVGSKLDGTGLEKEHMGQTQVPATKGAAAGDAAEGRKGLGVREEGVEEEVTL